MVTKINERIKKLHLGCFDRVCEGWLNTDITPHILLSRIPVLPFFLYKVKILSNQRYEQHRAGIFKKVVYLNVAKKFPHPDNSFDYVYLSHLLEHLPVGIAIFCISEIYRVLRKDGLVRICVPDLDLLVANYNMENPEEFLEEVFESNQKRSKNSHHWQYNAKSLTRLLKEAEFKEVYKCKFKEGRCEDMENIETRPKSLFIEAIK